MMLGMKNCNNVLIAGQCLVLSDIQTMHTGYSHQNSLAHAFYSCFSIGSASFFLHVA